MAHGRSRLPDALAVLPLIGFLIFSVPLIWGGMEIGTATALIYLFWGWFGLCLLTAVLSTIASRRMRPDDPEAGAPDP
ncbi:hypothetical protein [Poseidonocella sedimentorum]|uniref:Uncharacterized protein n=1 Tax=Poseidonocella sedimentorum TaxID=871652 RepID=A0A1I6CWW8_9RHOB|nr:hypothetical protein [Poseidonocella sedimentorum]SFQ97642.1 hypothetical protein SAMN04515673_101505 [Poseidonocella sedimentorum]